MRITYAIDGDSGQWWSRVEGHPHAGQQKVAVPVLDYDEIGADGDFTKPFTYHLEAMGIEALFQANLRWTRQASLAVRNTHREFWGVGPLRASTGSLTDRQAAVLAILQSQGDPMTAAEVTRRWGRRLGAAVPFLRQLAAKGLVKPIAGGAVLLWRATGPSPPSDRPSR